MTQKRFRRRLRSRIIISFLLFGTLLTASFAGATLLLREWLEDDLIESTLQREVDKAVERTRTDPGKASEIEFQDIRGEMFRTNQFANIPFSQRLSTGVYDITEPDPVSGKLRHYKLAVRRADDFWGFLRYDVTSQKNTQSTLTAALAAAVSMFVLLSGLIGVWSSRRIIRPVTELAQRLRTLEKLGKHEPVAPHFARDEVGELAAVVDEYADRLTELVERDKEFNADVSHELRTPLAVIHGATELLLEQNDLPEKSRQRLLRIERAVRQSTELTTALLLLSRNEKQAPASGDSRDVAKVVASVMETHKTSLGSKPVTVNLEIHGKLFVEAPEAVLSVALGNLIGNAYKYTPDGEVNIRVYDNRVEVQDSGPGVSKEEIAHVFERGFRSASATGKGAGIGLAIVRRLCDLYEWKVGLSANPEQGLTATIWFV